MNAKLENTLKKLVLVGAGCFVCFVAFFPVYRYVVIPYEVKSLIVDGSRRIAITEKYDDNGEPVFVGLNKPVVENRQVAMCIEGMTQCSGLYIDDPLNKKHYLGHFSIGQSVVGIRKTILENFTDNPQLKVYLIEGSLNREVAGFGAYRINSEIAIKLIYRAVVSSKIGAGRIYFVPYSKKVAGENIPDGRVLVKNGKLFLL